MMVINEPKRNKIPPLLAELSSRITAPKPFCGRGPAALSGLGREVAMLFTRANSPQVLYACSR